MNLTTIFSWCTIAAADSTTPPAGVQPPLPPPSNIWTHFVLPLVLVFGIMYLFILRPQHKREKQRRAMLETVAKGADVVTIGGIRGKVVKVGDEEVVLDVGDGTEITFSRGAIARVLKEEETKK